MSEHSLIIKFLEDANKNIVGRFENFKNEHGNIIVPIEIVDDNMLPMFLSYIKTLGYDHRIEYKNGIPVHMNIKETKYGNYNG